MYAENRIRYAAAGMCGWNVIEKPITIGWRGAYGRNVVEKPITLGGRRDMRGGCNRKTDYIERAQGMRTDVGVRFVGTQR